MEYSQKDAMMAKPLSIQIGRGTPKEIPILGMAATHTWLAYTDQVKVTEAELNMAKEEDEPEARVRFIDSMIDAVAHYCPSKLTEEEIMEKGTVAQIIEIYQLLVEVTDPFQYSQRCAMQRTRDQLKGIPMTEGLIEKGMELSRKP